MAIVMAELERKQVLRQELKDGDACLNFVKEQFQIYLRHIFLVEIEAMNQNLFPIPHPSMIFCIYFKS